MQVSNQDTMAVVNDLERRVKCGKEKKTDLNPKCQFHSIFSAWPAYQDWFLLYYKFPWNEKSTCNRVLAVRAITAWQL